MSPGSPIIEHRPSTRTALARPGAVRGYQGAIVTFSKALAQEPARAASG